MNLFGKILLYLASAMLGVMGILFLFWPRWIGGEVALGLTAPAAATDVRAVYGGFELGVAIFLAYCATHQGLQRIGLLAAFLGAFGFAVGRGIGMWVEGSVTAIHRAMFIFELTSALVVWLVYRRTPATVSP